MACQRRGYGGCNCTDCQVWIRCWEREEKGWNVIDSMMSDRRSLYSIYDRLQAEFPDMGDFSGFLGGQNTKFFIPSEYDDSWTSNNRCLPF